MPIIESATGVINSLEIAKASNNNVNIIPKLTMHININSNRYI